MNLFFTLIGPYSLIFVLPNETEPLEKIRTKGIRHPDGPFKYIEDVKLKMTSEVFLQAMKAVIWTEDPILREVPNNFVHEKLFIWEDAVTGENYFSSRMTFHHIKKMLQSQGTLTSYYGGMKKIFIDPDANKFLGIMPLVSHRTVCKTDWWQERSGRVFINPENSFSLTVPLGYEEKRRMIDYALFMHVDQLV